MSGVRPSLVQEQRRALLLGTLYALGLALAGARRLRIPALHRVLAAVLVIAGLKLFFQI